MNILCLCLCLFAFFVFLHVFVIVFVFSIFTMSSMIFSDIFRLLTTLNVPLFECVFADQLPNFLDLWRRELAEELVVCRCRPRGERLSYHRSRRAPQTFYPGMIVTMLLFYCFDLVLIWFDVILICFLDLMWFYYKFDRMLNFIGLVLWIPSTQFPINFNTMYMYVGYIAYVVYIHIF